MGEEQGYLPYPAGFETAVVHFAREPEQWSCSSVTPPISTSTTFKLKDFHEKTERGYPNKRVLENLLAHLENGKYCTTFPSGSAATSTCLALLNQNDHVICSNDIYGGTRKQFLRIASKFGIETSFVDSDPESFQEAITPKTRMIWIESPTNPSLQVFDLKAISEIAKRNKLVFIVDNTFLSCFLQRPLNFGVDISMNSVTKYLNGHTDVLMGAICTNDEKLFEEIKSIQRSIGAYPSPFDCSMVVRGLQTYPLRIKHQAKSSIEIAKFLENHPKIERVSHPGLESHPGHEIMKRQTSGYSGMVTFWVKGDFEATEKFLKNLKIVMFAGSLGGTQTVVEIPNRMSHFSVAPEVKKKLNYTDSMVRMSVGLECTKDLIEDLKNALTTI